MWWEHLGNAAHVSCDDEETAAGCLQNGDAERFGETRVEEDVTSAEDVSHFVVGESAEQFDSTLPWIPWRLCLSTSSSKWTIPEPSPPMMKLTFSNWARIFGMIRFDQIRFG